MTRMPIATLTLLLLAAGCESSTTQPARYQPTDGRNLAPAMQEASHGDPQWPDDIDRGGGGGTR